MEITCKIREDATKKGGLGWETVKLVAPLSIGNYLDKQLDERYISFYSKKEIYRAGAIVGIGYKKDGQPREWEYFILGRDSSAQSSFKKNIYFHQDAFLLEATKYLEGILCQSITFTNVKISTTDGTDTQFVVPYNITTDKVDKTTYCELTVDQISSLSDFFHTPVKIGDQITIPSLNSVANVIIGTYEVGKSSIKYDANGAHPAISIGSERNEIDSAEKGDNEFSTTAKEGGLSVTYLLYIGRIRSGGAGEYIVQYAFTFDIETKPQTINILRTKPWTISSVIDRIFDLAEPLFQSDENKPTPRFRLSSLDKFDEYFITPAPEFTLTECNLREQLQTVGGFLHAEPRATYAPDENEFIISFDDYGNPETVDLPRAKLIERRAGVDLAQYATEVKSNAQNLVNSSGAIVDPAIDFFRTVRSENVYVRITEKNARITTQHPIYKVEKIVGGIIDAAGKWKTIENSKKEFPVDITDFLVERAEYDSHLSAYDNDLTKSKAFYIYYTQGAADIDGLFYQAPNADDVALSPYAISNIFALRLQVPRKSVDDVVLKNPARLAFCITYTPIFSETVSHGKSKYDATLPKWQQAYNQSGNMIDTSYYGENLRATAAMLGNPEEERTYLLPPAEELPTVGQRLDDFAVSAVKAEIYPRYTKATLALTRDFERISEYVGINSTKRVYEVSEKEVYNRNVLLKSYIVIGTPPGKYESDIIPNLPLRLDMGLLADGLSAGEQKPVSCVYATMIDNNGREISRRMLPVVISSFGSTMSLSFSYKDNYSAGEMSHRVTAVEGTEISGYWLKDVTYANAFGRAEYLKASFFKEPKNAEKPLYDYFSLPTTSYTDALSNPTIYFQKPYLLEKDSREKISVHVSIEFKTESDGLILGSALARMNGFVGGTLSDCYVSLLSRRCGKMQRYIASEDKVGKEVKVTNSRQKSNGQTIAVSFAPVLWSAFKNDDGTFPKNVGWAVYRKGSDGKEEILLACNQPLAENRKLFESGFTFYQMNA